MDLALVLLAVFLVSVLLCPLSIIALIGWSAWSRRRRRSEHALVTRSATDDAEIRRMLDREDI